MRATMDIRGRPVWEGMAGGMGSELMDEMQRMVFLERKEASAAKRGPVQPCRSRQGDSE